MADQTMRSVEDIEKAIELLAQQSPAPSLWWTTENAMTMSAAILLFGLLVCGLVAFLSVQVRDSEGTLRTFGTIVIIVSSLFLVVAGYSDQQIAPVVGLLGTIAGYLLGKETKTDAKRESTIGEAGVNSENKIGGVELK